jgi:hypothetical protein
VAERLRILPDDDAVVRALGMPAAIGLDPRRQALVTPDDARGLKLDAGSRSGRAEVLVPADPRRLDIRAEGPGLLVVSEGLGPGLVRDRRRRARCHRAREPRRDGGRAVAGDPSRGPDLPHARPRPGRVLAALTALVLGLSVARGARGKRS